MLSSNSIRRLFSFKIRYKHRAYSCHSRNSFSKPIYNCQYVGSNKSILDKYPSHSFVRYYSQTQDNGEYKINRGDFERICEETLESLCENLETILESHPEIKGCDITFGDGVLTLTLGANGTYVINRQTPNKQIWLSSPKSGPKRYDYSVSLNTWIYKHDNISLHTLLQEELTAIFKSSVDLSSCTYCVLKK